jgi:hypothetical protein
MPPKTKTTASPNGSDATLTILLYDKESVTNAAFVNFNDFKKFIASKDCPDSLKALCK